MGVCVGYSLLCSKYIVKDPNSLSTPFNAVMMMIVVMIGMMVMVMMVVVAVVSYFYINMSVYPLLRKACLITQITGTAFVVIDTDCRQYSSIPVHTKILMVVRL